MSAAALRSPNRPKRGVKLSGLRAEEEDAEEAGLEVNTESGAEVKDNPSAPDTSEADGLSSGLVHYRKTHNTHTSWPRSPAHLVSEPVGGRDAVR